jgi:hypothetical protein
MISATFALSNHLLSSRLTCAESSIQIHFHGSIELLLW